MSAIRENACDARAIVKLTLGSTVQHSAVLRAVSCIYL